MRPFQAVTDMVGDINRMRQLGRMGYETWERTQATPWVPAADIFATGSDVVIRVELAGVRRSDVEITFADGVLTVSGERGEDVGEEEVDFYVRERFTGAFRRSMTLPAGLTRAT